MPPNSFIAGRDDSDLLVALRRRDPEAAGILHDRYGKPAYAIALRVVKDPAAAEDIVAEAVLKLWNRVVFFKETRSSALGVWFLVITYFQAREYAQQRDQKLSGNPTKESALERPILFQDWQRAMDSDRADEIRLGLFLLTEEERNVLDAGFFEAIPLARVGERVGQSSSDIEKLIESSLRKVSPRASD